MVKKSDFEDWYFGEAPKISEFITHEIASEAAALVLNELSERAYFPIVNYPKDGIGGKAPRKPLVMYARLDDSRGKPHFVWDLEAILHADLQSLEEDGSYSVGFLKLAGAMERMAKRIRAASAKGIAKHGTER